MITFETRIMMARYAARKFKYRDYWLEDVNLWDERNRVWQKEIVFIDLMTDTPNARTIGVRTDFGLEVFAN